MDEMVIRLIGKRLYIDGFVYEMNYLDHNGKVHWQCVRHRRECDVICDAKVITSDPSISEYITLFEGLEESKHNHRPSLADREEAEELEAMDTWKKKSEILSIDRDDPDYEPDPEAETSSDTSSQSDSDSLKSSETSDKDKSTRAARSSRPKKSYHIKAVDYTSSQIPPIIIGNQLKIDQFVYMQVGASNYSSRIYWRCVRYRSGECNSTAITSNPFANQELIVFKGPNESEHDHPPIHSDTQEFEEAAKFVGKKERPKSRIIGKPVSKTDRKTVKMSTCHRSILEKCAENQGINNLKEVQQPSMEDRIHTPTVSSDGLLSSTPKLIGRRLYLDGYIYSLHSRSTIDDRNHWVCRRYHKTQNRCPARATTSDPAGDQKLIVFRGPALSKHNHSPSEDEIRESERIAIFGNKRGRKPRIITQTSTDDNSNQHFADSFSDSFSSGVADTVKNMNEDKSGTHLVGGSGKSSPKEIDQRPRKRHANKISRTCVEFERIKAEGTAKVTTSNHVKGLKLMGHRWGPEQSKHHHPPSLAELEDAKESVRLERRSNLRTITQTPISLSKNCKSDLKRSLVEAPSESESSASSKKRSEVTNSNRGRRKGSSLMSNPSKYRRFLLRFLKNPVFDTRHVFAALGSLYTSDYGRVWAFAKILDHRRKIENDLEILKNDPDANISALNYTSSFDVCEAEIVENTICEKEVVSDDHSSAAANETLSGEIGSSKKSKILPNNSDNETISTPIPQSSKKFSTGKTRISCKKSEEKRFRQNLIRPSASSTGRQTLSSPAISSTEMELGVKSGIESRLASKEMRDREELPEKTLKPPIAATTLGPDLIIENLLVNSPAISFVDPNMDRFESRENVEVNLFPEEKTDVSNENRHRRSPSFSVIDLSEDDPEEIHIIEAIPSRHEKVNDLSTFKQMPPVSAFILRKDGILPESPLCAPNLVEHGTKMEREVAFIDLTDEADEKPICTIGMKETLLTSEKTLSVQANSPLYSPRKPSIAVSMLDSNKAQIFDSIRPNPVSRANLRISNPRIRSQDQCLPSNSEAVGYNSSITRLPNDISDNFGFNCQFNAGDVQIPLLINFPSVDNDGASRVEQLHMQLQARA
ncbi:hypothetical protein QAD02_006748 [Eretmocerus hayati]|uniref:Uncharacterized protein n=1 Tax=Eretmocerus hayati TaxID=131215 RepID=A0ACC2N2I6_9HYME|nr:hypothetical protein QAD02_006748 [Eretmocerus hayati]